MTYTLPLTKAMVAPRHIFTVLSILALSTTLNTLVNIYHDRWVRWIAGKESCCCLPMQKFPAFLYPVAQSLHLLGPHPVQPPSQDLSQSERARSKVEKKEWRRERSQGRILYLHHYHYVVNKELLTFTFVTALTIFTELPFFTYWLIFLALINVWGWLHYWHVNAITCNSIQIIVY